MAENTHEPFELLSEDVRDLHRAFESLIEELEAVNWYNQRADVTQDAHLKAILLHNRDEEIEHASMALEWIRRRVPKFDEELRTYLFTEGDITAVEESATGEEGGEGGGDASQSPTVGGLRKKD